MEIQDHEAPTTEVVPLPGEPLAIQVTQPARDLVLRALVRQAVPMLRTPEGHSRDAMRGLARTLEQALDSNTPICGEGIAEEEEFDLADADNPFEEMEDCCDCGCSCE